MFKRVSLRWRMTIMTALLLSGCCIGLTLVLNFSTFRLAGSIVAAVTTPAQGGDAAIDTQPMLPLSPADPTQQAKQYYQMESILFMVMFVLLGSALTYYVAGRTLEPVKSLNEQVKKLGVRNLSDTLSVPPTRDELAELTQSFNEMTDKLHEAFSMQQRFSVNVAHELRTPLTVLQTKIDVFHKKSVHTTEEYQALITAVQKQTTRLRDLIKNLLDMTNMESAKQEEVFIQDLLEDIIGELSCLARDKQITLSLQCGKERVYGVPDLLYRVFYNLIENAINYNTSGGQVLVEVCEVPTGLSVAIKDTGIGIPDAQKSFVFEPFYRVDSSRSREIGGAGLGLAMVDSIVRHYGGTIELTSLQPHGTCFKVMFHQKK